jgi:hypothetical protein
MPLRRQCQSRYHLANKSIDYTLHAAEVMPPGTCDREPRRVNLDRAGSRPPLPNDPFERQPCVTRPVPLHIRATPSRCHPRPLSWRDVSIALGLVGHQRDPAIADYLDRRQHLVRGRALLANCNGTLLQALDALRSAHLSDFFSDLRELRSILGFDLLDISLHQLRRRSAEREYKIGFYALLDQRLPRLINDVEPLRSPFPSPAVMSNATFTSVKPASADLSSAGKETLAELFSGI